MRTPFKMKGFSGFGNSPMKQETDTLVQPKKSEIKVLEDKTAENLKASSGRLGGIMASAMTIGELKTKETPTRPK
jgi:hypothetical protein